MDVRGFLLSISHSNRLCLVHFASSFVLFSLQDPVACHIESSPADASSVSEMLRDLVKLAFETQVKAPTAAFDFD
jgi:hypothetical protein